MPRLHGYREPRLCGWVDDDGRLVWTDEQEALTPVLCVRGAADPEQRPVMLVNLPPASDLAAGSPINLPTARVVRYRAR